MNYIEQFMKDNDIEVNEEFYVINKNGKKIGGLISAIFYFNKNMHLKVKCAESDCRDVLRGLMLGECKIEKIPKKPKTVWDLKDGDEYYYIDYYGEIKSVFNECCDEDVNIIEIGNAFLTEKEAEFEVERRKCEAIMLKYGTRDMMSFGDGNKSKYCLYLNNFLNKIIVSDNYCVQSQGTIYFESKELAQKAIEEVGEDRLKKYVFNVKE